MGDVYQVGGIEAKLTVDTTAFEQGMARSGKQMEGLYARVQTMPPALQRLVDRENELTRKITEQKQKVAELDAALSAAADQHMALEKAMGRVGDVNLEETFSKQVAAITKEEGKLNSLQAKLKQVEAQQQEFAEKINATSTKTTSKIEYKEQSLAIDAMANSMRALTPILGSSVTGLGNVAERLIYMKQAMKAAEAGGAALGVAISGGVTLAVSAVGMVVGAIQEAEEAHQKELEEARQALLDTEEQMREFEVSMRVLDSQKSSLADVIGARQDLADLFPQMVLGYDDERNAVLRNTQEIEKQIDLLKERTRLQRELVVEQDNGESLKQYRDILEETKRLQAEYDAEMAKAGQIAYQTTVNGIQETYYYTQENLEAANKSLKEKLLFAQSEVLSMQEAANKMIAEGLRIQIDGYDDLNEKAKIVANDMIASAAEKLLAIENETDRLAAEKEIIEEIRAVLGNGKEVTDRYNVIVNTSAKEAAQQEAKQREQVSSLYSKMTAAYKEQAQREYTEAVEAATKEVNATYKTRKDGLDAENKAVQAALKTQQSAYQSLKFDIKSLDEQDLANKLDLFHRQLAAEQDLQARSILAVQERYYEEARLIVETASKEIQVHKDKLAALNEADRQAEEAKTARQNAAKLRDLNERYSKQQAENERELAEKTKEYEKKRDELQAIIDHPPSRTAGILAQRELDALNAQWMQEREGLELDHADKLLQIQRDLDEEKLSQQEAAEAVERQKEREKLNNQITNLQDNAKQQLAILNNRYTAERDIQQKALSDQLTAAQDSYQRQLNALNSWKEQELADRKDAAERIRDSAIEEENLTARAIQEIQGKSYDDLLAMMDEYGVNAEEKAKEIAQKVYDAWKTSQPDPYPNAWTGDGIYNNMPGRRTYPAYGDGGHATSPTFALVAEKEPEWMVPDSRIDAMFKRVEKAKEELNAKAYYAMLPLRAKYGVGGGDVTTTNNNQRAVTYNIEKIEIINPNDARMATMQLESMGGGLT